MFAQIIFIIFAFQFIPAGAVLSQPGSEKFARQGQFPNSPINYNVQVDNPNPSDALTNVTVTDKVTTNNVTLTSLTPSGIFSNVTISGNTLTATGANIPAGGSIFFEINGTVTAQCGDEINNTITASAENETGPTTTSSFTSQVSCFLKTASAAHLKTSQKFTYTLTIANNSSSIIAASILDKAPPGIVYLNASDSLGLFKFTFFNNNTVLTTNSACIQPNTTDTITIHAQVAANAHPGSITNSAALTVNNFCPPFIAIATGPAQTISAASSVQSAQSKLLFSGSSFFYAKKKFAHKKMKQGPIHYAKRTPLPKKENQTFVRSRK